MAQASEPEMNHNSSNNEDGAASKKKRKFKDIAPYGNYRFYYGYRVGGDMEKDPRFKVLKKEWFEGKDCLDIGCNNGLITINIAKKFHCRTILGIDIDHDRIEDAKCNLRNTFRKEKARMASLNPCKSKAVEGTGVVEQAEVASSEELGQTRTDTSSTEQNLLDRVSFRCENFVTSWRPLPLKHYDTIVCLSVTKWVHLNWGDEGLISLFAKIWRLLRPEGIFVLEPQPWESYYKNRLITETTQANFHKIKLYPKSFQEILLDKIGFRSVENAASSISGATAGFNRPVLVFHK